MVKPKKKFFIDGRACHIHWFAEKDDSCYSSIFKDFLRFLQIALGERWGFIKAKDRQNDNWRTCLKMSTTCSKNGGRKSDGINR